MINARIIFALFLLFCSGFSFAVAPGSFKWKIYGIPTLFNSTGEACAYYASAANPNTGGELVNPNMYRCDYKMGPVSVSKYGPYCPDGSSPDTTQPLDKQCKDPVPPPPVCKAELFKANISMDTNATTGKLKRPDNVNGCHVEVANVINCWQYKDNGEKVCRIEFHGDGVPAAASSTPSKTDSSPGTREKGAADIPPGPIASNNTGKCPGGTTNIGTDSAGTPICAGSGTNPELSTTAPPIVTKPPVVTSGTNGDITTVKESVVTNADGSQTTTKQTTVTAVDGTTTTGVSVITGKNPNGENGDPTKNPPPPQDPEKTDFCKQNPSLSICKNSSVSGACAAVSCEGDAIQCATLRQASEMNCRAADDAKAITDSSAFALGSATLAGNDPLKSSLPTSGNAAKVTMPSSLDSSGWLGGGSCFADKSFTVQGRTFVVPFNKMCDYLIVFRYALMIVALLASFKILSGAIFRE